MQSLGTAARDSLLPQELTPKCGHRVLTSTRATGSLHAPSANLARTHLRVIAPKHLGRCLSSDRRNSQLPLPRLNATDSSSTTPAVQPTSVWEQKVITLPAYSRGCHVVTRKIVDALPELLEFEVGMANLFIQHTSASLTINENASPDVPKDLNDSLDKIVPEGTWYRHLEEGMDDMPAHVKSSLMGPSLDLPITAGRLALGTWQGIYLNEHRNYGGARKIVVTMQGCKRADGRKYPANQSRW